ncbi:hypothetical protein F4776DRAFT_669394 [Hypoxylon sp. NC0597]|nr:hypothetical protein F4776DRAFT_669394 [Hypoxylon sp. NC0597]
MDSLPQTIVNDIIDLATVGLYRGFRIRGPEPHKRRLASLATVSKKFQCAIERNTFKTIILTLDRIRDASDILSRFSRWSRVSTLGLIVLLPKYDEAACTRSENAAEQAENSRVFTQNITELFHLLSQRPSERFSVPMGVSFVVFSPTDTLHNYLIPGRRRAWQNIPGHIGPGRYASSILQLDQSVSLASIEHSKLVTFSMTSQLAFNRGISPDTIRRLTLAVMQPNLGVIALRFKDMKSDLSRRIADREDIARAINSFPSLNTIQVHFIYSGHLDQRVQPPVLLNQDSQSDPVSCALRRLSQRTKHIVITSALGSTELFWPKDHLPETTEPHWQWLETLKLVYRPMTPDGRWLFERDNSWSPREVRTEVEAFRPMVGSLPVMYRLHRFRHTPIQELMDEFYIAAGRAVANMPKLTRLVLTVSERPAIRPEWESPHAFCFQVFEGRYAVACWRGSPRYTPSTAVLKVWRRAAYERGVRVQFRAENFPTRHARSETPGNNVSN